MKSWGNFAEDVASVCTFIASPQNMVYKYFSCLIQTISTFLIWSYTLGVKPDGPCKISNCPGDVAERMCSNISGSGRNMIIDNWFTSYELVHRIPNRHSSWYSQKK